MREMQQKNLEVRRGVTFLRRQKRVLFLRRKGCRSKIKQKKKGENR